jgi:site-specific DNA-methyltransferase (adenine-specific)
MSKGKSIPSYVEDGVCIQNVDVSEVYSEWDTPTTIISDGAYGTGLFPDEPDDPYEIDEWYEPHIKAWSQHATPETTLWFWNTELGWAEVHPLLKEYGWEYRGTNIWNKGMGHIAGNSNTKRLRKFPQVTEVCVQYVRKAEFEDSEGKQIGIQQWVINEWERSGLTRQEANEACGVADAASRKYLTKGDLWYYPPPERMESMVEYANEHGDPEGKPYFAPDGEPVDAEEWRKYRSKFNCPTGVTNVWEHSQVNGAERVQGDDGALHINQKPLELMRRIVEASTEEGDTVWEPFGGLCTGAVASKQLNRRVFAAEIVDEYYDVAVERIQNTTNPNETKEEQSGIEDWEESEV